MGRRRPEMLRHVLHPRRYCRRFRLDIAHIDPASAEYAGVPRVVGRYTNEQDVGRVEQCRVGSDVYGVDVLGGASGLSRGCGAAPRE